MEKALQFWLNIRERYCHKKKTPTIIGERSQYEQTLLILCHLCQPYPCIVRNDFGVEIGAVELVRSEDLMSNIDLCSECATENLFVKTDRLSPHAVFLDDVRENIVVFLKCAD
jgi:hypothetical protein